jgi:GTP-binding protein YchF
MSLNCGIVGLPNVGKSTLFNALTASAAAAAANYPFCTIEPNVGRVGVPDPRLYKLAELAASAKIIPTTLEVVDIAGLVKGASTGAGLGNQFLGHIRSVDAIIQVLRCFEDDDITHVEGRVDPLRDAEIIETELLLADLESLQKRIPSIEKKLKTNKDPLLMQQLSLMHKVIDLLNAGKPARAVDVSKDEKPLLLDLQLLTAKPMMYICNVAESEAATGNAYIQKVQEYAKSRGHPVVMISAAIEAEIIALPESERQEFLQSLGLHETGLDQVIRAGYQMLDLLTFFTSGPKEARAWTVHQGAKAPQAAGVIHTDFERGFICAETIAYEDYVAGKGEQGAKALGKMRQEGRDYLVKDGDIFHFRFNV